MKLMRLLSEDEIRAHYAPKPNPYADAPQTFACQQIEVANAMRNVLVLLLQRVRSLFPSVLP